MVGPGKGSKLRYVFRESEHAPNQFADLQAIYQACGGKGRIIFPLEDYEFLEQPLNIIPDAGEGGSAKSSDGDAGSSESGADDKGKREAEEEMGEGSEGEGDKKKNPHLESEV